MTKSRRPTVPPAPPAPLAPPAIAGRAATPATARRIGTTAGQTTAPANGHRTATPATARRIGTTATGQQTATPAPRRADGPDDAFFRHTFASMRNGALALTREGLLALINDEAYRIFEITPRRTDLGQPIGVVLRDHPNVVRLFNRVFDLRQLPNRAELRLRPSGKVIGYTLALVRDDTGCVVGVSMFFEDLTPPAAPGEMAAAIAHEVKGPVQQPSKFLELLDRGWETLQARASESFKLPNV